MKNKELPLNPFNERRKQFIERTRNIIIALTKDDGKIKYTKLKAVVMRELGVTETKASEYIKLHEYDETIHIKNGHIFLRYNIKTS